MIEDELKGFEVIAKEVEEIANLVKSVEMRLEAVKNSVCAIIGDPLRLSYGCSQSLGNGQAFKTEIVMSRECTLSEAMFVLTHRYGVDCKAMSVKGRIVGEDYSSKVKSIEVIESWGQKEYIVTVESKGRK